MSFLSSKPKASLLDLFKAHPDLAKPLQEFTEAVMRGPSPFSEGERELIAAYVSSLNGCEFCRSAHTAVAERLGMPASIVDELLTDIDFADIPEKLKPVMRYVRKLNEAPSKVQRADAEAVIREVILAAQPTKQFVESAQLGALAVFLSSDAAATITGTALSVDGGWTAQ